MASRPKRRVLVVDDEKNILSSLRGLLEDEGYTVATAATAKEGLERLRDEPYDLSLFDVRLPDIDGIELLERARAARPELPIIMMSGHASIDLAVRAVQIGAYDFLEKPLSPERLLVLLRNAIERGHLVAENRRLREERGPETILGECDGIRALRESIAAVAPTRGRVLILGESGTGKELVARAIHEGSERSDGPFVKMNCAAIPKELIESVLFGHEKGAFTGATASTAGKFEQAHGGTLLLDEVGDMHAETQAKLLRVLEGSEVERVGGRKTIKVDVRVISATNKKPLAEIEAGRFREDLYFRLAVVPIEVPPLHSRGDDVILIAEHFLDHFGKEYGRTAPRLSVAAKRVLLAHPWPGNVRELRNVIERGVILLGGDEIGEEDARHLLEASPLEVRSAGAADSPRGAAGGGPGAADGADGSLSERLALIERRWIEEALRRHDGRVADAARELKVDRANLHRKMKRLGIERSGA